MPENPAVGRSADGNGDANNPGGAEEDNHPEGTAGTITTTPPDSLASAGSSGAETAVAGRAMESLQNHSTNEAAPWSIHGSSLGAAPSMALARSLPLPPETLSNMSPMDLFVSQLSTDSAEARVDAMKRLSTVANAMGTDGTLTNLLPYVATNVAMDEEEDDEILLLLAFQLGRLVPGLIPGPRSLPVLPVLERLAAVEETVVREKAVESINRIIPTLLPSNSSDAASAGGGGEDASAIVQTAPTLLLAMAKRLASADWFTAKVSAAGILPEIYRFFHRLAAQHPLPAEASEEGADAAANSYDEARRELRALYKELSEDETPMVRRSAAKHLGRFLEAAADLPVLPAKLSAAEAVAPPTPVSSELIGKVVIPDLLPIFTSLNTDEQDSVRLLAVVASGPLGRALGCDANLTSEHVLQTVKDGCADLSWRVRHSLAKDYATVASAMGFRTSPAHQSRQADLFYYYSALLQDTEAEVRAAAVTNVARVAQLAGGPDLFQSHLSPILPALADDPVMEVRSELAQALMDCVSPSICDVLPDSVILSDFRPLLEGFLNDEFPEVQLHILTKLSRISHLLGKMDAVVGSILAMANAQNWRVREAVGRLLPHLAEARGISFFEDHLLEPWLALLLDQVANVRMSCVDGMSKLLSVAGATWLQREILPQYRRIYDESISYLTRSTILKAYASLCAPVVLPEEEKSAQLAAQRQSEDPDKSHFSTPIPTPLLEDVLDMMLRALEEDAVPNVRIVAARALPHIATRSCDEALVEAKIRPALESKGQTDADEDCRYFIQLALETLG